MVNLLRKCLAFLLLTSLAHAGQVRVDILEESTDKSTTYWFEVASLAQVTRDSASTTQIPQAAIYSLSNGKLIANGIAISAAEDILYQCQVDGFDLVIVRVEHNSVSNPWRVLVAFSGHPIQVSTIYIMKIKDHKIVSRQEITHKPASYKWYAKMSQLVT